MKTEEKSDFLVMQEMSSGNMDIACAVDILNYDRTKKGGKVTFGVASPQFDHLCGKCGKMKDS